MTDRFRAETADEQSPFSRLIERRIAFRIELAGLDLSVLTEKECAVLGEQCERLGEQLEAMLAHLATFETVMRESADSCAESRAMGTVPDHGHDILCMTPKTIAP